MNNSQFPWLKFLETCHSTNTWAREQRLQLRHGDVVFTPRQTAGRGQHGRNWISPAGVLTASFILDGLPLTGLSLIAGLAVIVAVELLVPDLLNQLQLKWVNDVWLDRRKLAGILCEASGDRAIVGVGLNRLVTFPDPRAIGYPVSLHEFVDRVPSELSLILEIRCQLLKMCDRLAQNGLGEYIRELNFRDGLKGRQIIVQTESENIHGRAIGIDEQGRLQLQAVDGQIHNFIVGRVIHWESSPNL